MDPQGRPEGHPIEFDLNSWSLVMRDGVATLVPREPPNQAALVQVNRVQNGNNVVQSNSLISQGAYEQALALDFSSQNTPLTDPQHQFLRGRLESLRETIAQLEDKIDTRRRLTMNHEAQGAIASGSRTTNSRQIQQGFMQTQQNTSSNSNQVFYSNGAQNVVSSASGQGDYRHYQQATASSLPAQSSSAMYNAPSSSRNHGVVSNAPPISNHQRQASGQVLTEVLRQNLQQAQQSYMGMNQDSSFISAPQASQANMSRALPNANPLSHAQNIQFQQAAPTQVQAGMTRPTLTQEDYRNLWHASSQASSHQAPNQPPNSFPNAHISSASVHSTPQRSLNPNANASTSSNIPYQPKRNTQPQQPLPATTAPVTVSIPPAPTRTPAATYENLMRTVASSMSASGRVPPSTISQHPQPVVAPMVLPIPMAPIARIRPTTTPVPLSIPPQQPRQPPEPVVSNDVPVKEEPEEELSLAQSILQFYGKRKEMDSAGIPEPASKRRAVDSAVAHDIPPPPPQDLPMQDGWTADIPSGLGAKGLEDELSTMEKFVNPNFEGLGFNDANSRGTETPPRTAPGDIPMLSEELDTVHSQSTPKPLPHISPVVSIQENPRSDPIDDFPRVEMLSDEMNIPDSRSPSAARLSSVSESDPHESAAGKDAADAAHREEAEVEGAVLIDSHTDEHQRTPVPERKSASPLFFPSVPLDDGNQLVGEASPMLRSPSIPLFSSIDKGKRRAASRSRSPSLPLFLPMPSSGSSSDVETLKRAPKKDSETLVGPMIYPRRRFLGVNVPFVPGLSRKRPHKVAQKSSRRRRPLLLDTSSSEEESSALLPDAVDVNGHGINPYSSLKRSPCLWTGCGAVLDSQMKLMRHVEVAHAFPQPPGPQSQTLSRCRWGNCRKQRTNTGASNKILRHLIKHINPVMVCMADGCLFTIGNRTPDSSHHFLEHWNEAHKDDPNLTLKPSIFPDIPPSQPSQELPESVPAWEALFLPVHGDPGATFRSRPPSPQTPSQATSVMPLSPTKHTRSSRVEKKMDEYSFLDPFYPPNLFIEDLAQNAMDLFDLECRNLYIGNAVIEDQDRARGSSEEP